VHRLKTSFIQHAYVKQALIAIVKQALIAIVLLPQLRQNVDFHTSKLGSRESFFPWDASRSPHAPRTEGVWAAPVRQRASTDRGGEAAPQVMALA
jgi:hypothetical protein